MNFLTRRWHLLLILIGVILTASIGWSSLNPWSQTMFDFHDETQVGRITSFTRNLESGNIPPRLAPEFSFDMGMPVFNFYAPSAYWITSFIALAGAGSVTAVKISFLLTLILSFVGMYFFLTRMFKMLPSFLGATIYVTSTYFATEIVIRGNLSESWFLALFPFALGLIFENAAKKPQKLSRFATPLVLALLFTSHNMMGLLSIVLIGLYIMLFKNKKKNIIAMGLALLINSYFFIPVIFESQFIQAGSIAKNFNYVDHFLCPWQLWSSNGWQFGGSLTGCDADLMSFKLGKPHLVLGAAGMVLFLFANLKTLKRIFSIKTIKKLSIEQKILGMILVVTVGSLFLTQYESQFIWSLFEPIMSLFQFPWRFLVFGMFGIGVFGAYFFDSIDNIPLEKFKLKKLKKIFVPLKTIAILGLIAVLFATAGKYFKKPPYEFEAYDLRYNSESYLNGLIAYNIREYLVEGVNYDTWHYLNELEVNETELSFDSQKPFEFEGLHDVELHSLYEYRATFNQGGTAMVNIHYFPFWEIRHNDEVLQKSDMKFDELARPIIKVEEGDTIQAKYKQTPIEQTGNIMSLVGFGLLGIYAFKKKTS